MEVIPTGNPITLLFIFLQQELMRNHTDNWAVLLQSDLGISDVALSALLQHRHDFQADAQLDQAEKKHVDTLKSKFNIGSGN